MKFKMEKEKMLKMSNITQKWVDVMKPFTRDYSARLTATEIAKLSGVSQQTTSRILNSFVKLNLIDYAVHGKNKLFYFNKDKVNTLSLFAIAEGIKAVDFDINFPRESLVIAKLVKCCEGVILFGSHASGKSKKDSDFDVVLLGKCDENELKRVKEMSPLGIHEQVVSYEELKKTIYKKHPLALEISDNHILFGDISRIIKFFLEVKNG